MKQSELRDKLRKLNKKLSKETDCFVSININMFEYLGTHEEYRLAILPDKGERSDKEFETLAELVAHMDKLLEE